MQKPVKIIKKPDDLVLRASVGGSPDVGFYCVYRGDIHKIIQLLGVIRDSLTEQFVESGEPEVTPEDGRHK